MLYRHNTSTTESFKRGAANQPLENAGRTFDFFFISKLAYGWRFITTILGRWHSTLLFPWHLATRAVL